MTTDTTGLPQPPIEPSEWLLPEAHERVVSLIHSLKESGGISANDAYNAPQDARLAHQHGEYDILYPEGSRESPVTSGSGMNRRQVAPTSP